MALITDKTARIEFIESILPSEKSKGLSVTEIQSKCESNGFYVSRKTTERDISRLELELKAKVIRAEGRTKFYAKVVSQTINMPKELAFVLSFYADSVNETFPSHVTSELSDYFKSAEKIVKKIEMCKPNDQLNSIIRQVKPCKERSKDVIFYGNELAA
ncbi:hypothetical protein [Parashewanella tropica]|uniref:hypothetical protein n=1 Tax=Parashewanella tropica TaxID=2547970 RepID=UPI0010592205|nr:hypothetical protein [Parashewanella tropica]